MKLLSVLILSVLSLMSCSVYRASRNPGVSVREISVCSNQQCLLAHGMNIVKNYSDKNHHYIEIFRAPAKEGGFNYVRAIGHGTLDVATFGLWEVAGTPIEGLIKNNRGFIIAKVTYLNRNVDKVLSIEYFDNKGRRYYQKRG